MRDEIWVKHWVTASSDRAALEDRLRATEQRLAFLEQAAARPPALPSWPKAASASPTVSVILPVRNRAAFVGEAIASVIAQSWSDWELIVVDDGSTDDIEGALAPFLADRRIGFIRQPHGGAGAARNRGLAQARARVVAFLDSDNIFYGGFLAAGIEALRAEPGLGAVYGILVSRHHDLGETELLIRTFDRAALVACNFIDINTVMARKSTLDAIGGFDPALRKLEDWDLMLRLTEQLAAKAIPVLAAYYRVVDSIRVSNALPDDSAVAAVRRKHGWQD